ncbi:MULTISPECIES: phasin family protein [Geomicrobium]|uniref:Polyhydroxyalkanoate synthesis regulator phasin n=1 Tax=Geomicrobium sediminis TaxID=1347788 RepID=A0ABS2PET7_9BACL|nr:MULTISPECIES: hypothetical protein [Geomicrobium]MBM7633486.1 polyhydroxyalkanoate synthesis regulator phasin [Geomicrobium sediminis]GAK00060.1 hypothetical protein JCM19055_3127 [Geomicrobium sp. JCM 19055]GAK06696.1 hypothetical protein JCM19038_399 [Geomicrobium sp. JCM 19038]
MNEWLKNGFFLGLGAAVAGTEKVQTYLDDLVSRGRITPKEAEQFADELIKRGETKEQEWTESSKTKMKSMFNDMGLATRDDLERVEEKLTHLESLLKERQMKDRNDDNE